MFAQKLSVVIFSLCLVLVIFTSPTWSYAAGAPQESCNDMTPRHGIQPNGSLYVVTTSKPEVTGGETISVTIKGNLFKGFLVMARADDEERTAVGKFVISEDHPHAQTLHCSTKATAATHKKVYGDGINSVNLDWKAPDNFHGTVRFVATVVKTREEYWSGITSDPVVVT